MNRTLYLLMLLALTLATTPACDSADSSGGPDTLAGADASSLPDGGGLPADALHDTTPAPTDAVVDDAPPAADAIVDMGGGDAEGSADAALDVRPAPEDTEAPCDVTLEDIAPDVEADVAPDVEADVAPDAVPDATVDVEAPADIDFGPAPPADCDRERLDQLLLDLSADEMRGRLTGTASGDLAEAYLADRLEEAGADVVLQPVEFPLYEVGTPVALEELDEAGEVLHSYDYFLRFREVDFAGSGAVTGDLVFVGYGITHGDYDSYAGLDVEGKIVAILTSVPSGQGLPGIDVTAIDYKLDNAYRHGAAGVIFVLAGAEYERVLEKGLAMELSALSYWYEYRPELHHDDLPAVFIHAWPTRQLLGRSCSDLESDPTPFTTDKRIRLELHGTTHPTARCNNVFVTLPGHDPALSDEVLVVGAHYDHLGMGADGSIFNGAADNATGTAVVLESALTLLESDARPHRTVMLALWCAEEQGLYGSMHYVNEDPLHPIDDTVLMIQVDYLGEEDGPYVTNVDDGEMIQTFLGNERDDPEWPLEAMSWGGMCASDDCPFLEARVPAHRFIAYGSHHHQPSDTYENLSLDMVARTADIVLRGIGHVAY